MTSETSRIRRETEIEAPLGELYVIRKGGYFYRADARGYTAEIDRAWKLPKKEAEAYAEPGAGVTIHPASEFPEPSDRREGGDGMGNWRYGTPPAGGNARKLVTLTQDGMMWVGIRQWNEHRQAWVNNGVTEEAEVVAWDDLPSPAPMLMPPMAGPTLPEKPTGDGW